MRLITHNTRFEVHFESDLEREVASKYFYITYEDKFSQSGWSSIYLAKSIKDSSGERNPNLPIGYLSVFKDKCLNKKLSVFIEDKSVPQLCRERLNSKDSRDPREWQKMAIERIEKHESGIISAPTGTGKSFVISSMVNTRKGITLVVVPSTDIQNQLADDLSEFYGKKNISTEVPLLTDENVHFYSKMSQLKDGEKPTLAQKQAQSTLKKKWHKPITILCWHSLEKLPSWYLKKVQVAILDEFDLAHIGAYRHTMMLMDSCQYKYGLSATPWPDKPHIKTVLSALIGDNVIFEYNVEDAIDDGVIAKPSYNVINSPAPDKYLMKVKNYREIIDNGIVNNTSRNKAIINKAMDLYADNHKVFIAVDESTHGEILLEMLKNEGCENCGFINGDVESKDRDVIKAAIPKEKDSGFVLIGTMAIGRGTNVPSLDRLVLASGGKAFARFIQRIGRIMRAAEGKDMSVEVWDMFDWWNPIAKKHSVERKSNFAKYFGSSGKIFS